MHDKKGGRVGRERCRNEMQAAAKPRKRERLVGREARKEVPMRKVWLWGDRRVEREGKFSALPKIE